MDISGIIDTMSAMDLLDIFKALSNRTRLDILKGLKDPAKNFPPQDEGDVHTVGVCVSSIQEGVGLSQSTVSDYLATLHRAGLVDVRRIGQWTYYKRNEATISALADIIGKEL
jgi:ArsR family transcriptional regulator